MHKEYQVVLFTDFTDTVLTAKPLGAYKIASSLREVGYSCLVIDHLSRWTVEDMTRLLNLVISAKTLFVGFSTSFLQSTENSDGTQFYDFNASKSFYPQGAEYERQMVALIKQLSPKCKIILGGHKISENCTNRNVDIVVQGLAEISILNIANSLYNNQPIGDSYRNIHGITVVHRDQEKEYDFANSTMHWEDTDVLNYRVLPMEPARGCIFNCKFCNFPQRGKKNLDFVVHEEIIYNELKSNYERFGITTYQLLDDTFNDNDHKLDRMLDVVKQLNFQPLFWAYNRLDLLATKPERIQKIFDIGIRASYFGIETLKRETGLFVGKGFGAGKQIETVREIRRRYGNNFLMHGLFIIGLPHETLSDIQNTFDMIMSQELPLHSAYIQPLNILKSGYHWVQSDFDKNWQKYGYEDMGSENSSIINWRNQHMTVYDARAKQKEFSQILFNSDKMHIPGQTAWNLMNYPSFDLTTIQSLKNNEIDWGKVDAGKQEFVAEYKKQLFDILEWRSGPTQQSAKL